VKFQSELIEGIILKRYKRFLADVELPSGEVIVAHTANTGSMKTCWEPGWKVLLSYHDNPKRKLKYSLEMTHNNETWIGINTGVPNKLGYEAIEDGTIKELQGYKKIKPEVKIGKSRIDLLLSESEELPDCYVEIKNVTLKGEGTKVLFPDAVTERGQKHLNELMEIVESGKSACMLYIVQREDVDSFSPADLIDTKYGELLREASNKGVKILCYQCSLSPEEIKIVKPIPVIL
jgi:sugar fermentation stimulation protein A